MANIEIDDISILVGTVRLDAIDGDRHNVNKLITKNPSGTSHDNKALLYVTENITEVDYVTLPNNNEMNIYTNVLTVGWGRS